MDSSNTKDEPDYLQSIFLTLKIGMVQYKILFRTDVNCGKKETETGKIII